MPLKYDSRLIQQLVIKDVQTVRCYVFDQNVSDRRLDIMRDEMLAAG